MEDRGGVTLWGKAKPDAALVYGRRRSASAAQEAQALVFTLTSDKSTHK